MGTVTALSGLAIKGDTGNNTVNNFGTVTGNVILGSGTNGFNNMAGGFFNTGATVNLGAGDTLTNTGTLSPGGAGVIQTTALTGNLVRPRPACWSPTSTSPAPAPIGSMCRGPPISRARCS